jgi:hypothetical protein
VQIEELASWCRSTFHPILLRLGYEFDRHPPVFYNPDNHTEYFPLHRRARKTSRGALRRTILAHC